MKSHELQALGIPRGAPYVAREAPAPYKRWGRNIDSESIRQIENACALPVAVAGALMPDAHPGYGLPIGGVLATDNAVVPYAVGVDIACRVKMSVLDMPVETLDDGEDRLRQAIEAETRFGIGCSFTGQGKRQHTVMDADWSVVASVAKANKDRAWKQLGTSGSGNHFVEFGTFAVKDALEGLAPGTYLALLSHSGSRGTGAAVADHYSKLAQRLLPELPRQLRHLAWLDMTSAEGREYWAAMELMGQYAAANHACIHQHIVEHLGAEVLLDIENHHNFAWKEEHGGQEVIVHRKGATPAGVGVIGIIPGSMASPAFVVRGKGQPESLLSAAHGAGRVMSRKKAKQTLDWAAAKKVLAAKRVTLLSAGLDEVPFVYKDIETVMADQADLVEVKARFDPRLVKMAPQGERPED
jgi:tRNA-splicing ligase RtcB